MRWLTIVATPDDLRMARQARKMLIEAGAQPRRRTP